MSLLRNRDTLYTLIGVLLALFLGALDQTIVSTALPQIVADLNGVTRYAWVATAYLLASTVMVPIYGKLADTHSRKLIELWAIGFFLGGSLLCGISGEFGSLPVIGDAMNQLIVFRAIQGLGGAGLFALAFIIIADLFPPAERGKYQGLVGAVFGISSVLGPLVGGFLTDHGGSIIPGIEGWRWVFYVNVPFGALALWFIVTRMPRLDPLGERRGLNYVSALLLVGGLTPLVLALQIDKQVHPWNAPFTIGLVVFSVVSLVLFSVHSLRARNPVLDFSLFQNRVFSVANAALFLLGTAFLSLIIFLPLFMVNVLGVSATSAGVSLIPLSIGVVLGSTAAGQLVSRFGHYRRLMIGGGIVLFVGVVLLSRMDAGIEYWQVTSFMVICGLGLGPSLPLYPLAIQNAVDVRKVGQATSASQFFRQIGGAIGTAIMGTVLAVSLVGSFQHASDSAGDLPFGGQMTASEGSGVRSAGSGELASGIEAYFERQYAGVEQAVASGDSAALHRVLHDAHLPDGEAALLEQPLSENPADRKARLGEIKAAFDRRAEAAVGEARSVVADAFATAITRIFFFVLFPIAAGVAVTFFLPELPLRRTLDTAEAKEGAPPSTATH